MTTAAIHANVIAGKATTLSPYAPASPGDLDKQHELGQFLTMSSNYPDTPELVEKCFRPER